MAPTESGHHLRVVDSRTEKGYLIPIHDNFVRAKDLGAITIPDTEDQNLSQKLTILDNGYENTACMSSSVTHIDGQRGRIEYRGTPIQDLFHNNDFEDVLHLLIWSKLPSAAEKKSMLAAISAAANPPKSVMDTVAAFPRESEPYPMLLAGLSAFVAIDKTSSITRHQHKPMFHNNLEVADQAILRTIGYLSSVIALVYCHKRNKAFTKPAPGGSLVGNLLLSMGFVDPKTGKGADPKIEACLNKLWILYADHEMTNSTAGFLHAASTLQDPVSCVISGIVCGYGPLHGGAIDLAYEALEKIKHPRFVPTYIDMVKAKKARLFGYGHRIYKTRDPRLGLIEELIEENKEAVASNPLLKVAFAIDKQANEDPYFVSRNLKANADLLGCFLYSALGFEKDIIIAMISLSRVPGGLAHWRETLSEPIKLWRPLQIYSGKKPTPLADPRGTMTTSSSDEVTEKAASAIQAKEADANGGRQKGPKTPLKLRMYLWARSALAA
ncbi:citrate synthase [Bombardia bombarda]|uniref:Citrate synthase n=1 Tax=Bombardia bombarda TaxID=252184 RepID=A0AA39XL13_9PEZI|nr:citrate synthase [Bombardia bombarda]